jgi:flotillin
MEALIFLVVVLVAALVAGSTLAAIFLRRVVPTNEVHIVQSAGATTSYGKDSNNGNTYWAWPAWVPVFGIVRVSLPTSVFDIDLEDYEAFDKGRLPFAVDVKAFFRVSDSNLAAQRVANFDELKNQLTAVVQGAVRVVLGTHDIEEIMQGRSGLGDAFTKEVNEQLAQWGVTTVKNIELMDLRDGTNGKAIHSIMEKKKSHIDMESRVEVAKNSRLSSIAEVDAKQQVELRQQEAVQAVGLRTVAQQQAVEMAKQTKEQAVKEAEKTTKEKEMAVLRVGQVRQAEIDKEKAIVKAEQERQQVEIAASATLEQQRKLAEGSLAQGSARAESEKLLQLAPVQAQITLAKEIGANQGYQSYLVTLRKVEADQAIGLAQAAAMGEALGKATVKVIANTGNAMQGISSVGELFSPKGGLAVGSMVEALANTDAGKAVLDRAGVNTDRLQ